MPATIQAGDAVTFIVTGVTNGPADGPQTLQVSTSSDTTPVSLSFSQSSGVTISGTVSYQGNGVSGAPVEVCPSGGITCVTTSSAGTGTFSVEVPVGTSYTVTAHPSAFGPDAGAGTTTVAGSGGASGVVVILASAPMITPGVTVISPSFGTETSSTSAPATRWDAPFQMQLDPSIFPAGETVVATQLVIHGTDSTTGLPATKVVDIGGSVAGLPTGVVVGSQPVTVTVPPLEPLHGQITTSVNYVIESSSFSGVSPAPFGLTNTQDLDLIYPPAPSGQAPTDPLPAYFLNVGDTGGVKIGPASVTGADASDFSVVPLSQTGAPSGSTDCGGTSAELTVFDGVGSNPPASTECGAGVRFTPDGTKADYNATLDVGVTSGSQHGVVTVALHGCDAPESAAAGQESCFQGVGGESGSDNNTTTTTTTTTTDTNGNTTTTTEQTTTNEDGSTTTVTHDQNGVTVSTKTENPDGSTTTVTINPDGTVTTSTTTQNSNGTTTTITQNPDGSTTRAVETPNGDGGTTTTSTTNGQTTTTVVTPNADGGTTTSVTGPDGQTTTTVVTPNADGTTTTTVYNPDGTTTTSVTTTTQETTTDPDNGVVTQDVENLTVYDNGPVNSQEVATVTTEDGTGSDSGGSEGTDNGGTTATGGMYIDPSGTVSTATAAGLVPVAGATVTLEESSSQSGPFTVVPDDSSVMSPGNRTNPGVTDGLGSFGWDVLAGYYLITATAPGCATASSPVLDVPPPASGLDIVLSCATPPARASTATTLTASSSQLSFGQPLTLTARVTGTGSPAGTVTFADGTSSLGSAPVDGGTATLTLASLASGTHPVTATYGGDAGHEPATSAAAVVVVHSPEGGSVTISKDSDLIGGDAIKVAGSGWAKNGDTAVTITECVGTAYSPQDCDTGAVTTVPVAARPASKAGTFAKTVFHVVAGPVGDAGSTCGLATSGPCSVVVVGSSGDSSAGPTLGLATPAATAKRTLAVTTGYRDTVKASHFPIGDAVTARECDTSVLPASDLASHCDAATVIQGKAGGSGKVAFAPAGVTVEVGGAYTEPGSAGCPAGGTCDLVVADSNHPTIFVIVPVTLAATPVRAGSRSR